VTLGLPTNTNGAPRATLVGTECWDDGLIDETIRIWESRYGRTVDAEEAALILTRVVEFVRVLAEHSQPVDPGDPDGEAGHGDQVTLT
jgi:hypothetical protein